jgi:transcriptional regulator with XRE-family HTH domain
MKEGGAIMQAILVDTIGETIRTLRKQQGMTQEALSAKAEVDPSAIASLELGRRKAGGRVDTLLRLLGALGMECVIRPTAAGETVIRIATEAGWVPRRAWRDPDIPGLAVAVAWCGDGQGTYTVTHVPSGRRLVPRDFVRREDAIMCMRWLGQEVAERGLSWDVPPDHIRDKPALETIRRQAAKAFGGDTDA